jgi:UDP-glucose 4-epimerase
MKVLITGGAGFIGSHTCLELLNRGDEVIVVDNLHNSSEKALERVRELSGSELVFEKLDMLDQQALAAVFERHKIDSVIHFAGYKAVGESNQKPLDYYHNNLTITFHLLEIMQKHKVKNLVFSSSSTVYGEDNQPPLKEHFKTSATNPYGKTKLFIEIILQDFQKANQDWNIALLRYFNPIGAHSSGQIGENPNGIPNNLLPFVSQVAVGKLDKIRIFGNDYPTPDGTGVRDYIHVVDLALGHLKALDHLASNPGLCTFNLGTGRGYSVLEVIKAFEKASEKSLPYEICPRREGDLPISYADASQAEKVLGWKAERDLDDMCRDTWNWQQKNPHGFDEL